MRSTNGVGMKKDLSQNAAMEKFESVVKNLKTQEDTSSDNSDYTPTPNKI